MMVKELMSTNICFAKETASAADAMLLMKQYNVGFIPVCNDAGEVLGVITDRDILLHALPADTAALSELPLSQIMHRQVIHVPPEMDIHDAALKLAKNRLRRLIVLEGKRLIGVLSISDLAKKRVYLAEVGDILGSIAMKKENS